MLIGKDDAQNMDSIKMPKFYEQNAGWQGIGSPHLEAEGGTIQSLGTL